jgi:hypothetical protein
VSIVWLAPLVVTLGALAAAAVLASRTVEEAARLRSELRNAAGLRPALLEVRAGVSALRASLEWFGRT